MTQEITANVPEGTELGTSNKPADDELQELKAQLESEMKDRAEFEVMLAEKDSQVNQLSAEVNRLTATVGALKTNSVKAGEAVTQLQTELSQATAKYRDLVMAANPSIPADLIQGTTIGEINAAMVKARSLIAKVKQGIEAETKAATVPAGAPVRTAIIPEGLSSREKISYGVQQKKS